MYGPESVCSSGPGRFLLLAPFQATVPQTFRHVGATSEDYERVLAELQRLRGHVYLQDGAINASQLTNDGRHILDVDRRSWHIVSVQPDGRITGCARYRIHSDRVRPEDLGAWHSPLAHQPAWRRALRYAVEAEIDLARQKNVVYVEVGGWAIAEDRRFTLDALDVALSTYALARTLGGCVGITTATTRNRSSSILRKIGGSPLESSTGTLPSYYDPQYRCEMELLRFDSGLLNPRFQARIDDIQSAILDRPVLCATGGPSWPSRSQARPGRLRQPDIDAMPERACA
jgi:hypothetical protein